MRNPRATQMPTAANAIASTNRAVGRGTDGSTGGVRGGSEFILEHSAYGGAKAETATIDCGRQTAGATYAMPGSAGTSRASRARSPPPRPKVKRPATFRSVRIPARCVAADPQGMIPIRLRLTLEFGVEDRPDQDGYAGHPGPEHEAEDTADRAVQPVICSDAPHVPGD